MTVPRHFRATGLLVVFLFAFVVGLAAAPAAEAAVARAIVDVELQDADETSQAEWVHEFATQLRARYLRLSVEWNRAEPVSGVYDEALLARVGHVLDLVAAENLDLPAEENLRVVITVVGTPRWASDRSYWNLPPIGKGVYEPYFAPCADAVDDFGTFAGMLAARFKGRVFAYECWNEPNLWTWFYPQVLGDDEMFAARRYTQLLKAFAAAVHDPLADPDALVIGGVTAPVGSDKADDYRTSPQRFARFIKYFGALSAMDAYAHHPYQGGPGVRAPEAAPIKPSTTVTLANLGELRRIVGDMPFYLTEYGYNTAPSAMFGVAGVSEVTQAGYLKRAYRYAARYSWVKALFWYLRRDASPSGSAGDPNGVYTGLRTITNARKRSWFAFAGGMQLKLSAQSPIRSGSSTKLTGNLICSRLATETSVGGLSGKPLEVQRRVNGGWQKVKVAQTRTGGGFTTWIRLSRDTKLRVCWRGVIASRARFVDVR
jgi:hypothetical protein